MTWSRIEAMYKRLAVVLCIVLNHIWQFPHCINQGVYLPFLVWWWMFSAMMPFYLFWNAPWWWLRNPCICLAVWPCATLCFENPWIPLSLTACAAAAARYRSIFILPVIICPDLGYCCIHLFKLFKHNGLFFSFCLGSWLFSGMTKAALTKG